MEHLEYGCDVLRWSSLLISLGLVKTLHWESVKKEIAVVNGKGRDGAWQCS